MPLPSTEGRWEHLGSRRTPILEAHLRLLGWTTELERLIGTGFREAIVSAPAGGPAEFFAAEEDCRRVEAAVPADTSLPFRAQFAALNAGLLDHVQAEAWSPLGLLGGAAALFALAHLARIEADKVFALTETSVEIKRGIERWRNEPGRFAALDLAWGRLERERGIAAGLFASCTADEMRDWLGGVAPDWQAVAARADAAWGLGLEDGLVRLHSADLRPETEATTDVAELRGVGVAPLPPVRGRVGTEILVATMTRPEDTERMRAARAVVTDEGGLLSHAAIICRELGIPCVIGTRIATKVLHEGDLVEVDPRSGIVNRVDRP